MGSSHLQMKCNETAVAYFRVKNICDTNLSNFFLPLFLKKLSEKFNFLLVWRISKDLSKY